MAKSIEYSYRKASYYIQVDHPMVFSYPTNFIDEEEDCPQFYSDGTLRQYERHCAFFHTLSGRGECWRGNERYSIGAGESFLTVINDPLSGYCYPDDGTENWRFRVFCFDGLNTLSEVTALLDAYGSKFRLAQDCPFLRELKPHADWAVEKTTRMELPQAHALVQALYSEILESVAGQERSRYPELIRDAIKLMHERCGEAFQVCEIADALGVSREYLSRHFRAVVGITLTDYTHRQQALHICRMLKYSNSSVQEIARSMGYENPSGLTMMFKRVMNVTPSEFRRAGSFQ